MSNDSLYIYIYIYIYIALFPSYVLSVLLSTNTQTGLKYVLDAVTLRNNEAMEHFLQSVIEQAIGMLIILITLHYT